MGIVARFAERLAYVSVLGLLLVSIYPRHTAASLNESDWFSAPPVVHDKETYHHNGVPYSINGNRNCTWRKVVTVPHRILPVFPFVQHEQSHESCVVDTGFGAYSQSGYLQVAGETVFGKVSYPNGATLHLIPVPRSPHALYTVNNAPNGVRIFKVENMINQLVGTTMNNGERQYRLKSGFVSKELRDKSGNVMGVRTESISFSNSGKWMVADVGFVGMVRINIPNFEVRVFDSGFNYSAGSEPGMQSAVSMSGRYVAIGSRGHTRFALYDLDTCTSQTRCNKLDLWQFFRAQEPTYEGPARIRFSDEFSMKFYNVSRPNGVRKTEKITLAAHGHEPGKFEYLALGDSFASGEGAFQYKAETDTGNNKCHVSQRAYPYLIAEALSIAQMESVACAGADIEDINNLSESYEGQVSDNIARENRDENLIFDNFLPGFIAQEEFLRRFSPESITLSISGNDIGFSHKVLRCLMPDTCYATYEDRLELANEINGVFDTLLTLFADIQEHMEGKRVYIVGYPSLVADDGNCALNVHLNAEEVRLANQIVNHLNNMIRSAANRHGYFYVDVEQAFKGQRLCEAGSMGVAVNGLTAGNDTINLPITDVGGPIGNESFHPNHRGHELFKQAILAKTNNLTAPMPQPDPNASTPVMIDDIEMLKNAPRKNRSITQVKYDDTIGTHMAYKNSTWKGFVSGFRSLTPSVKVYLHSDPVLLGTFSAESDGSVDFEISIPPDTPVGYHTIRVVGETIAGSPYVIEKIIFVAADKEDFDGDGIPNTAEVCLFGEPAGIDTDKDGVDDACDGFISEAPESNETDDDTAEEDISGGARSEIKIPLSNGDPKPPENNPETVAGHEQTNNEQNVLSASDNTEFRGTNSPTSPYFTDNNDSPAVLASNTSDSTMKPERTIPEINNDVKDEAAENTDWWLAAIWPAGLLLVLCLLYPLRKQR